MTKLHFWINQPAEDYLGWLADIREISGKKRRKNQLEEKMSKLKSESVDAWEAQKKELQNRQDEKKAQIARVQETIWNDQKEIEKLREDLLEAESGIAEQRRKLAREFSRAETESKDGGGEQSEDGIAAAERVGVIETSVRYEEEFQRYLSGRKSVNYDYLKRQRLSDLYPLREAEEVSYQKLVEERSSYVI